jgi:hypothetical protein
LLRRRFQGWYNTHKQANNAHEEKRKEFIGIVSEAREKRIVLEERENDFERWENKTQGRLCVCV